MSGVQGLQPTIQLGQISPGAGLQQNFVNMANIRAADTEWFNTTGTGNEFELLMSICI